MRKQGRTGDHLRNGRVRPPRESWNVPGSASRWRSGHCVVSSPARVHLPPLQRAASTVTQYCCLPHLPDATDTLFSVSPVHTEPVTGMGPTSQYGDHDPGQAKLSPRTPRGQAPLVQTSTRSPDRFWGPLLCVILHSRH